MPTDQQGSPISQFRFTGVGVSQLELAGGNDVFGTASGTIDINFANRTIGGGQSFVQVVFPAPTAFSLNEALAAVSFDRAADGFGVFGFDSGDFSGTLVDSAIFALRNNGAPLNQADLIFRFSDGAGGLGIAEVTQMTRQSIPNTPPPQN
ncbi:MAG: hypothetical protein Tsb0010_15520 [Parvularculaceae bacterium]